MRFTGQAQFHPRKYLLFLAEQVAASGGFLFENTRATDIVQEDGGKVALLKTDRGDIRAAKVIVATNMPFFRRELFSPLLQAKRSFVLGVRLEGETPPGLYYSVDPHSGSIRNQPLDDGTLLMVGCWDKTLGSERYQRPV